MQLQETEWLWERLAQQEKPVVLYGMGNGADKILELCRRYGVPVQDIFASDEFVRGQRFAGFPVRSYAEICAKYPQAVILVSFGTERPEVLARIYAMAEKYEVLAPDVPLFGTDIADRASFRQHESAIQQVYAMLADEASKQVLENILAYKWSGKIAYLQACSTPREEVFSRIFSFSPHEVYLDAGAYDGDTVEEFIRQTAGHYERILALEPDKKNFVKLERRVTELQDARIVCYPYAVWNENTQLVFNGCGGRNSAIGTGKKSYTVLTTTLDRFLAGQRVSYVKMDVEGAEKEALLGGIHTLQAFSPQLAISAYHRTWDIVELPLLLKNIQPAYQIYLRHHPYIPAWETNLYAIAKK